MAFISSPTGNITITSVITDVTDSPSTYYNTWAAEIGVSNTGTDAALDDDDNAWLITPPVSFLDGYASTTQAMWSSEGGLGFYLEPCTDVTPNSPVILGINRMYALADRPNILYAFHPANTDAATVNAKIKSSANVTIISSTVQFYGGATNVIRVAIKIETNKITLVSETVSGTFSHILAGFNSSNSIDNTTDLLYQTLGTIKQVVLTVPTPIQKTFSGTITETSDINLWNIKVYSCNTGQLIQGTTASGSTYSMAYTGSEICNLTISPKIDYQWSAAKVTLLNDLVVPANPDATPHLFKVTTAGTFGATEASWNLTGTTTQGTAILTYVAPLLDPVTIGPKVAT